MQIKFTVNITGAWDDDGDIEVSQEHYDAFTEKFREEFKDTTHELVMGDTVLVYEMEDIDEVCDICHTSPCACEAYE